MDFRQLQYITAIAEYKSITRAAEALYISQSAMSHYVQKAESELGVQLFDRSTTPLTLTYAGQHYIESARKILLENNQLMKKLRDITHHMTGKLRVGTSRDRASYMMPRIIPEFVSLYPGIEIEIFTGSGRELREALREGRIDLFLLPEYVKESMQGLACQDIYTEELVLASKKGMLPPAVRDEAHPYAIKPGELSQLPFFLMHPDHIMRSFCDVFFKKNHVRPQVKMEFSSNITCYHMASTGLGSAIIPYLTTRLTRCDQEMELYSLGEAPVTWTVQAVYRKDAYLGQPEYDFIDISRKLFCRETLTPEP